MKIQLELDCYAHQIIYYFTVRINKLVISMTHNTYMCMLMKLAFKLVLKPFQYKIEHTITSMCIRA